MIALPTDPWFVWNCRRGMLELDLILSRFVTAELKNLTDHQRSLFATLLGYPDPDLYAYLMGQDVPEDKEVISIVTHIRTYVGM